MDKEGVVAGTGILINYKRFEYNLLQPLIHNIADECESYY